MDALAALESIGDINTLRDRVRDLGIAIKHLNPSGEWVHFGKAAMLDDCRQLLWQGSHARARCDQVTCCGAWREEVQSKQQRWSDHLAYNC